MDGKHRKNLHSAGTTIAVINLDMLLERGGLLDQLRAKGYERRALKAVESGWPAISLLLYRCRSLSSRRDSFWMVHESL